MRRPRTNPVPRLCQAAQRRDLPVHSSCTRRCRCRRRSGRRPTATPRAPPPPAPPLLLRLRPSKPTRPPSTERTALLAAHSPSRLSGALPARGWNPCRHRRRCRFRPNPRLRALPAPRLWLRPRLTRHQLLLRHQLMLLQLRLRLRHQLLLRPAASRWPLLAPALLRSSRMLLRPGPPRARASVRASSPPRRPPPGPAHPPSPAWRLLPLERPPLQAQARQQCQRTGPR
mmetsp:Transcript_20047/g.76854  ORF Transcript_20047/g.76854 Transcript_20047/m.76854 type:complete len:229 (+) Transcript_20047:261-947(+)